MTRLGTLILQALLVCATRACAIELGAEAGSSSLSQGPRGFALPLKHHRHPDGVRRRRHLLRSSSRLVYGEVPELGYYYTYLTLGTPGQVVSGILDTGSTLPAFPCSGCTRCGPLKTGMFKPNASSTSSTVGCFDARCSCGSSSCTCSNNQCGYSIRYLEGSSTSGFLTEDALEVGDGGPAAKFVFGCAQSESGLLYDQSADGVFGMGRASVSLHGQLVRQGVIDDVFSLCFGAPKEGVLLLGSVALPADAPAPVVTPVVGATNKYNIQVEGLVFNGEQLVTGQTWFSYGLGTIWDSGTTFSYFTRSVFNVLLAAIRRHVEANPALTPAPGPYSDDICWTGAPAGDAGKLDPYFPALELLLGGGVRLRRAPLHYLYPYGAAWCLGFFDNAYSSTLLGANMMLDTVVTYDGRSNQMQFFEYECDQLSAALGMKGQNISNGTSVAAPSPPLPPNPTPPTPIPPSPPPTRPATPPPAAQPPHPKRSKRSSPRPARQPPRSPSPSPRPRSRKSPPPLS